MRENLWTQEQVAKLKRMWCDKSLSARDIAKVIGKSRCAVLGKINRLGLSNRSELKGRNDYRKKPLTPHQRCIMDIGVFR